MGWKHAQLAVALLLSVCPAAAAPEYFFDVSENGETAVTIELAERATLALPPDVSQPDIEGGTYSAAGTSISVTPEETAVVTFTSSRYTRKQEGVWHFETFIPAADSVTIFLPQAVHVVQSLPRAAFSKDDRWTLGWENLSANISVSYVSVAQAEAARRALTLQVPVPERSTWPWIALVLALLAAYYWHRRQKPAKATAEKTMLPNITEGQMNVIRAANPNEAVVLKLVLKHNGHVKRNLLERESGLSKSSLASSLKNLEKKNIAIVDRTFFVHYVALSQWFKDLK